MATIKTGMGSNKAGEHSPYCAFRTDRDRLWALISRDIRLVLIAGLIAASAPSTSSYLLKVWAMVIESPRIVSSPS